VIAPDHEEYSQIFPEPKPINRIFMINDFAPLLVSAEEFETFRGF
jgi:hypothetical protein